MPLSTIVSPNVKKFLCLGCGAKFEELLEDELDQEIYCLSCGEVSIMPFRESATGQTGCSSSGCGRRVDEKDVSGKTGGCGSSCGSGGGCCV